MSVVIAVPRGERELEFKLFEPLARHVAKVLGGPESPRVDAEGDSQPCRSRVTLIERAPTSRSGTLLDRVAANIRELNDGDVVVVVGPHLTTTQPSDPPAATLGSTLDVVSKVTGLASTLLAPMWGPASFGLRVFSSSLSVAGIRCRATPTDETTLESFSRTVATLLVDGMSGERLTVLVDGHQVAPENFDQVQRRLAVLGACGLSAHLVVTGQVFNGYLRPDVDVSRLVLPLVTVPEVMDAWPCGEAEARDIVELSGGDREVVDDVAGFIRRAATLAPATPAGSQREALRTWLRARVLERVSQVLDGAGDQTDIQLIDRVLRVVADLGAPFRPGVVAYDKQAKTLVSQLCWHAMSCDHGPEWPVRTHGADRDAFALSPFGSYAYGNLAPFAILPDGPEHQVCAAYAVACSEGLLEPDRNGAEFADRLVRPDLAFRVRTAMSRRTAEMADARAEKLMRDLDDLGSLHGPNHPEVNRTRGHIMSSLFSARQAGTGASTLRHDKALLKGCRLLDPDMPVERVMIYRAQWCAYVDDPARPIYRELLELGKALPPQNSAALVVAVAREVAETRPELALAFAAHSCSRLVPDKLMMDTSFPLHKGLWSTHFVAKRSFNDLHDAFHETVAKIALSGILTSDRTVELLLMLCRENGYAEQSDTFAMAACKVADEPSLAYAAHKACAVAIYKQLRKPGNDPDDVEQFTVILRAKLNLAIALAVEVAPDEEPSLWYLASLSGVFEASEKILAYAHVLASHLKQPAFPSELLGAAVPHPDPALGQSGVTVSVHGRPLGPQDRDQFARSLLVADLQSIKENWRQRSKAAFWSTPKIRDEARRDLEQLLGRCVALVGGDITSDIDFGLIWDQVIELYPAEPS